jgi:hypothetical protein
MTNPTQECRSCGSEDISLPEPRRSMAQGTSTGLNLFRKRVESPDGLAFTFHESKHKTEWVGNESTRTYEGRLRRRCSRSNT